MFLIDEPFQLERKKFLKFSDEEAHFQNQSSYV